MTRNMNKTTRIDKTVKMIRGRAENLADKPRAFVGLWPAGCDRLADYRLLVPIGERIGGVSAGLANALTRPTRYTNMSLPQLRRSRPMRTAGNGRRDKAREKAQKPEKSE